MAEGSISTHKAKLRIHLQQLQQSLPDCTATASTATQPLTKP